MILTAKEKYKILSAINDLNLATGSAPDVVIGNEPILPWSECETLEEIIEQVKMVAGDQAHKAARWASLAGRLTKQLRKGRTLTHTRALRRGYGD